MIGLVLVTHGRLAIEFRSALEHVVGPQRQIEAITIGPDDDVEQCRKNILEAVKRVDSGEGVAILTDMFGGTPSNLAISVMSQPKVEVLAGINLPMLIKLAKIREISPLQMQSLPPMKPAANTVRSPAASSTENDPPRFSGRDSCLARGGDRQQEGIARPRFRKIRADRRTIRCRHHRHPRPRNGRRNVHHGFDDAGRRSGDLHHDKGDRQKRREGGRDIVQVGRGRLRRRGLAFGTPAGAKAT
jgi:PTS system mannose-specific IIA component